MTASQFETPEPRKTRAKRSDAAEMSAVFPTRTPTPTEGAAPPPNLDHIIEKLRPLAVAMNTLTPDPHNARKHGQKNLDAVKGSLLLFNQRVPLVVNARTGVIEKGNGTFMAARELGWTHLAVVDVDDDPMQAAGFAIADNRTSELAEWQYDALGPQIEALRESDFDLGAIGIDQNDVDEALKLWRDLDTENAEGDGESGARGDGSLLALANVTVANPTHEVSRGDVWKLGPHTLLCVDVLSDWKIWVSHLKEGCTFAPYPGPFVPLTVEAQSRVFVMVQPDPYIAGHILDQWDAFKGEGDAKRDP